MSDVIVAGRSPFEALDGLSMPGLAAAPDRTRHVLRGRADIHSPAAEVLGFALPTDACRAAENRRPARRFERIGNPGLGSVLRGSERGGLELGIHHDSP